MARAAMIDGGVLKDNLTDIYGDGNRLVYLNDVLDLIDKQPTLTPPNEPLTLEQLREMNGEPVYLVAKRYGISEWNILNGMDEIVLAYDEPVVGMKAVIPGIKFINGRILGVGSYGEDWLAYRRPKEEQ